MQTTQTPLPQAHPIVHLHIGSQQTQVNIASEALHTTMNIGLRQMGKGTLAHFPPKPVELEMAIEELENNIMPLAKVLPKVSELVLTLKESVSDELKTYFVADMKGRGQVVDENAPVLMLKDVEDIFVRLAELTQGGALSASGLPKSLDFVSCVLIVREFMHHLGFHQIHLKA